MFRLLAGALVIAIGSIAATAWLTTRTTTTALRRAEARSVVTDAAIYDALIGYAATHRSWFSAEPVLGHLSRQAGVHVSLTTEDRQRIPGLSRPDTPLPAVAAAVVDPLHVDVALDRRAGTDGIDPRALGPFTLTAASRHQLDDAASASLNCLGPLSGARIIYLPGGRPFVSLPDYSTSELVRKYRSTPGLCSNLVVDLPTPAESRALSSLNARLDDCLGAKGLATVRVGLDLDFGALPSADQSCVDTTWRAELTPYVAPPALLYITSLGGDAGGLALDGSNALEVVLLGLIVTALTFAVTFVLTARLTRPLRRLSDAVRGSHSGTVDVPVSARDEIGQLTDAFNQQSRHRRQLEEQRRRMIRDIAHELRGPVSNMRNWLEAAEDGLVKPTELLDSTLLDEALQLQHIISDLADLAAAESGELTFHPETLHVGQLIDQVLAIHRVAANSAQVELRKDGDGDLNLYADGVRVRQTLNNLITNAIRHTGPMGQITVRAHATGEIVEISVSDTGEGIAPADLPLIFDRFWRADPARQRSTGGSGLGLAIARQLAEAQGGRLTATSTLGHGSTFALTLPAWPLAPAGPTVRADTPR